ncbi:hypothetical protein CsSME_00047151 [Camellia sinensis var. sinensis]
MLHQLGFSFSFIAIGFSSVLQGATVWLKLFEVRRAPEAGALVACASARVRVASTADSILPCHKKSKLGLPDHSAD